MSPAAKTPGGLARLILSLIYLWGLPGFTAPSDLVVEIASVRPPRPAAELALEILSGLEYLKFFLDVGAKHVGSRDDAHQLAICHHGNPNDVILSH